MCNEIEVLVYSSKLLILGDKLALCNFFFGISNTKQFLKGQNLTGKIEKLSGELKSVYIFIFILFFFLLFSDGNEGYNE